MLSKLDWRKGLLRLWVLCSLSWIILSLASERPWSSAHYYWRTGKAVEMISTMLSDTTGDTLSIPTNGKPISRSQAEADLTQLSAAKDRTKKELVDFALLALAPCLALFGLGASIAWAISGFSPRNK